MNISVELHNTSDVYFGQFHVNLHDLARVVLPPGTVLCIQELIPVKTLPPKPHNQRLPSIGVSVLALTFTIFLILLWTSSNRPTFSILTLRVTIPFRNVPYYFAAQYISDKSHAYPCTLSLSMTGNYCPDKNHYNGKTCSGMS